MTGRRADVERVGLVDRDGRPLTRQAVERMTAERNDQAKRAWNHRLERLRTAGCRSEFG